MITFYKLLDWFEEDLKKENTKKLLNQKTIAKWFLLGSIASFIIAAIKYKGDVFKVLNLFINEGAAFCFIIAVIFVYLNLQEDEIDQRRIDFTSNLKSNVPEEENAQSDIQKPTYSKGVEDLVFDLLKKKLIEEIKYPTNNKE